MPLCYCLWCCNVCDPLDLIKWTTVRTTVMMALPSAIPDEIRQRLNSCSNESRADLELIVDPRGYVVGLYSELPDHVVLPGGLSTQKVSYEDIVAIRSSVGEETGEKKERLCLMRFRGMCHSAEHLREAEIVSVDGGVALQGTKCVDPELAIKNLTSFGFSEAMLASESAKDVEFFFDTCGSEGDLPTAPWCDVNGASAGREDADVPFAAQEGGEVFVDAVAYVKTSANGAEMVEAILQAVERQLKAVDVVVKNRSPCSVRHFAVLSGPTLVSVVSSAAEEGEDEDLEPSVEKRRTVHDALMLPTDRPLIRRKCAVNLNEFCGSAVTRDCVGAGENVCDDGGCPGRLADVHIGIKGHGLGDKGVSVHLVKGRYLYCHYMQDKFNDSGWGCAYRSLQTLMSWCVTHGLTSFPGGILPTHREIQQALVDVGDKPGKFVGSREWIGANECCYVLEEMTGVSSRILHVSRGSEMESRGRELARHFDDQGSPIMIGGGVLAWTILGVARDSRTGKTRFLILDPHYEGRDNLETIHAKGWVAWKSADIFKANSFYNLCIPQVPRTV